MCVYIGKCVPDHLRQHGILPPPGHADGEQVIDGGGVLQAGPAGLGLVRQAADHRFAAGLGGRSMKRRMRRERGVKNSEEVNMSVNM